MYLPFHIDGLVYGILCSALATKTSEIRYATPSTRSGSTSVVGQDPMPVPESQTKGIQALRSARQRALVEARARALPRAKPSRAWSWPLLSTATLFAQYIAPLVCCVSNLLHAEGYLGSALQDVKAVHGQCLGQQLICAVRPVECGSGCIDSAPCGVELSVFTNKTTSIRVKAHRT